MIEKRRRYSAEFEFKVALEAAKGTRTLGEIASETGVHPNQIRQWKRQLLDDGVDLFRHASARREQEQEKLDVTTDESPIFGTHIRLYTAAELIELVRAAGCSAERQHGVRCVNDYIPENELKVEPAFLAQLEQLELMMSSKHPYYLLARYLHMMARKAYA